VRILDVTERNMPKAANRNENMPVELICGNRRANRRYDIPLELRWKLIRRGKVLEVGTGTTIDLSSSGIMFRAEKSLPAGEKIELSIVWPAHLEGFPPIQLAVSGILVRSAGNRNAIRMITHEFRTVAVAARNTTEPTDARSFRAKMALISGH